VVDRLNALGQIVAALLLSGLFFLAVAFTRDHVDGAAFAAAALIILAVSITVWAAINRKRTHP
jgi:hypothetical protein